MLYIVYGAETDKARAKKDSLVASCRKQKPDAEFFVMNGENFSERALEELYSSQGLFVRKHVVVLDRVFPVKKNKDNEEENLTKGGKGAYIYIKTDVYLAYFDFLKK